MSLQKQCSGITLLEVMLVLAIGASLMVLGIKVYNQFQFQVNEKKIVANVNTLFQALEGFYHTNCRRALDNNSNPQSSGGLDPSVTDSLGVTPNVMLGVMHDLVTPGFLVSGQWQPNNPLLDNSPTPDSGYYVQFNRALSSGLDAPMNVYACTGSTAYPSCDTANGAVLQSSSPPAQQTRSVMWTVQVAVKLSPQLTSDQWVQIMHDLSATCISTAAGQGVAACIPTPAANGYLVWTRHPSAYNPEITSDFWMTEPYVKMFNMQYTNDGMAALAGVRNETQNTATANNWYNPLDYLCGG